jgi:hypothetical protein
MKLGPLRFLKPVNYAEHDGARILVVQSGAPAEAIRLVEALRAKYPRAELSLLARQGADAALAGLGDVRVIPSEGPRPEFVRRLAAMRFDHVYVLLTGDPTPWKLKLLPFLLSAGAIFGVNENLDWFPVSAREAPVVARHLRRRFESSISRAGRAQSLASRVVGAATYPAILAYLAAWEQLRSREARRRGARDWKSENRPAPSPAKGREAA